MLISTFAIKEISIEVFVICLIFMSICAPFYKSGGPTKIKNVIAFLTIYLFLNVVFCWITMKPDSKSFEMVMVSKDEPPNITRAIYFNTATTFMIGYGDIFPNNASEKVLTCIIMVVIFTGVAGSYKTIICEILKNI